MKQEISTNKAPQAVGPYSQAIRKDNFLFLSGQIPINPETGKIVEGGIKEQTKQVFENIKAVLNEAGADFSNVVKATVYLKNMDDFKDMNEIYQTYFDKPYPARAAFQVAKLPLDVLVEIEVIAIL